MLAVNPGIFPVNADEKPPPVNNIRRQDLRKIEKIGEGGSSTVFHMIWKSKSGDCDVAAKCLSKVDDHELEVLSRLKHPNIVRLIGVVPDELHYMLILELCVGGSLRSYLNKHKPLPPDLFDAWSKQAARAIKYLQEMKIIHKDIKSGNYLITRDKTLKLGDFGLAKSSGVTLSKATERGTAAYMAPELFIENKLSPTFDIFAYGVVLWELVTGQVPFEGREYHWIVYHVCEKKVRLTIPADCPDHLANLMKRCWLEDRNQRPSIKEILSVLNNTTAYTRSVASVVPNQADTAAANLSYQKGGQDVQPDNEPNLPDILQQDNFLSWTCERRLGHEEGPGKLHNACGIAVCPSGDVAVADRWPEPCVKVYTSEGRLKFTLDTRIGGAKSLPTEVAVGSDGTFFVTDETQSVKVFDVFGKYICQFPTASLATRLLKSVVLEGLAIDKNGHLLVGEISNTDNIIRKHSQNGDNLGNIRVRIKPQSLAVTSREEIIVSSATQQKVLIIDRRGRPNQLCIPSGVTKWIPRSVCSGMGKIFISSESDERPSITCYSLSGDYLGQISLGDICKEVGIHKLKPMGIVLTEDCTKLLVADASRGVVILRRNEQVVD